MPYIIGVARGAGYILNVNTAFVILLAARFFFTKLRDTPIANVLPFDKAFPLLHILVGYVIAGAVIVHGFFHFGWLIPYGGWEWGWFNFNMSVITGLLLVITFGTMLFFVRPSVRKNNFRLFYRVHIIGAFIFFSLLLIHGMYRTVPETYKYIVPTLIIYIVDRIIRRIQASATELQLTAKNSFFKDEKILELRVPKPFNYRAGQYAELQVPSINREWHPFTIASAPHEETLALYIKKLGDWTTELHDNFATRLRGEETDTLTVCVRGPYGAPCQHVRGYDRVLMISGGIGSTPFSALCKELHHLQSKSEQPSLVHQAASSWFSQHDIAAVQSRIYQTISRLYDVNVDGALNQLSSQDEHRSAFITQMLHLSSMNREDDNDGSSSDSGDDSGSDADGNEAQLSDYSLSHMSASYVDLDSLKKAESEAPKGKMAITKENSIFVSTSKSMPRARQKMIKLLESRSHLLKFLHSTYIQFFLVVTLIARFGVLSAASIWKYEFISIIADGNGKKGSWIVIPDTILSGFAAILIPATIALELSFMGTKFFTRTARILDFLFLLPASIGSLVLAIFGWARNAPLPRGWIILDLVVFLPLMFILLLNRLQSTLGGRSLIAKSKRCNCEACQSVPEVDFVWTTPTADDDLWLRQELEPLASGTELRLHRYITREKQLDEENGAGQDFITHTKLGRPDWNTLFSEVAAKAKSDSMVGVFFCGPHKMGDAVRKSIRKVETISSLKGAYLGSVSERTIRRDIGVSELVIKKLKANGCGVRFAFREENFG